MKSSRLRGAALAWGAILASGTAFSQAPFRPNPYGYPQQYSAPSQQQYPAPFQQQYPAPSQQYYPAPSQQYYPAPAQSFYSLPPANQLGVAQSQQAPMAAQPMTAPINLLGQHNSATYSPPGVPTRQNMFVSEGPTSVLAPPYTAAPSVESIAPGAAQPNIGQQHPGQNYYYGYGQSANGNSGMSAGGAATFNSAYPGWNGSGNAGCANGGYYDGSCGCVAPRGNWYAGVYGLWLSRDNYENFTFSFDTANEAVQFTNSRDVNANWDGGIGIAVGYCFSGGGGGGGYGDGCGDSCGCDTGGCALEFVYWGWFPDDVATYTYGAQMNGQLNGIFNWDSLDYNGANAALFVDNAQVHGLWRQTEVQNFEVNILRWNGGGYGPMQFSFLAGSRIFRYEDQLTFGSDTTDTVFDGDATELFYSIETVNKLYGFQIGGIGNYYATQRFAFNGGTKLGIFVNKIDHRSQIGGSQGLAVINNGPFNGQSWYVASSEEDVSFLGEVFLGASYCITPHWSLSAGYRAIAITGIATPTDQIYPDLRGINDVASIEANSSVILHGAYFGAQFSW